MAPLHENWARDVLIKPIADNPARDIAACIYCNRSIDLPQFRLYGVNETKVEFGVPTVET